MIGHLGLNVDDLVATRAYYDALMPAVDFEPHLVGDDEIAYRPAQGKPGTYLFLYGRLVDGIYSRHEVGLQHLAFMVPTRSRVHEVHELVVRLGSEVIEAPRSFPEYQPPYFATFWHDPNGFMLEAVCHHDRD